MCVCVVFRLSFCLCLVLHPVIRNLKYGRERRAASIVLVHVNKQIYTHLRYIYIHFIIYIYIYIYIHTHGIRERERVFREDLTGSHCDCSLKIIYLRIKPKIKLNSALFFF